MGDVRIAQQRTEPIRGERRADGKPTPAAEFPKLSHRPPGTTLARGVFTVRRVLGIERAGDGFHQLVEGTFKVHEAVKRERIDRKNVVLSMRLADLSELGGLPQPLELRSGQQLLLQGEYTPADPKVQKAIPQITPRYIDGKPAAILHYTHAPAGYVIVDGQRFD